MPKKKYPLTLTGEALPASNRHMLAPDSGSWRRKFNWANEHLDSLKGDIRDWIDQLNGAPASSVTTSFHPDRDESGITPAGAFSGTFEVTIDPFSELPPTWSLRTGDILFGFRCALDHLAWHLVQGGRAPPQAIDEERAVQFPIYDRPDAFDSNSGRCLPGVSRKLVAVTKRHQPFQGKPQHLALLHDLNNLDKHREIRLITVHHQVTPLSCSSRNFRLDSSYQILNSDPMPNRLHSGPDLLRVHAIRIGPGDPEMNMHFRYHFAIGLETGVLLDATLTSIRDEILCIFSDVSSWLIQRRLPPI